jgi:D-psicose/D-tagatose/L-ribulose 3-epimerase
MKIGINLLVLGGFISRNHEQQLKSIARAGYDGVEIPLFSGDCKHYRDLAALCGDLGLQRTASTAMSVEHDPCSADSAIRARAFDRLRWATDNAHSLGASLVCGPLYAPLGHFSGAGPTESELNYAADTLRSAAEYAASADIDLVVEPLNRFECYLLNTAEQGSDFYRRVAHPRLRWMYDTFHANIEERDPVGSFDRFACELAHIHIAESDRGIPGRGHAALAPVIKAARRSGYDRWLVIEAFGRSVPELAAATRVWRDLFPDLDTLYSEGIRFIKSHWS